MTWLDLIALTPVLLLVLGATTLLMVSAWYKEPLPLLAGGLTVALVGALAAGLVPPPVTEVAGLFGCGPYARFFTILWALIAALALMVSWRHLQDEGQAAGEYISLLLYAAAGMALLSAATSLIGLFLGLEVFTLAFYVLIAFRRGCDASAEAGLKYLVMGAVATGFMAFGIGLIYAASGSLHLPEAIQGLTAGNGLRPWGLLGWGLLLVAIGFKTSLVPFHLWTPDVYQGAPAPVASLLATGSKGAVMAALVGAFAGSGTALATLTPLLWLLAAATMLTGAVCALPQQNLKRLLAYSSIVHMGTLLVGLLCFSPAGFSAAVFYIAVYSVTSLGTFAVIASLADENGEPQELSAWQGLGHRHPVRCAILAVLLLSLAGMPPTAGFMAKFAVFHAAIQSGYLGLALLGILASLLSFAFYLRVIMVLFMTDEQAPARHPGIAIEFGVLAICLSVVLLLGLFPGLLFDLVGQLLPLH